MSAIVHGGGGPLPKIFDMNIESAPQKVGSSGHYISKITVDQEPYDFVADKSSKITSITLETGREILNHLVFTWGSESDSYRRLGVVDFSMNSGVSGYKKSSTTDEYYYPSAMTVHVYDRRGLNYTFITISINKEGSKLLLDIYVTNDTQTSNQGYFDFKIHVY